MTHCECVGHRHQANNGFQMKVLYNTLEGLTCLWDLEDGGVKAKYESYQRSKQDERVQEPGQFTSLSLCLFLLSLSIFWRSVQTFVRIYAS